MKPQTPEILALVLIVLAFLFPPWKVALGPEFALTKFGFIFSPPDWDGIPSIDPAILLIELGVIAGVYYLVRRIADKKGEK